MSNKSDYTGVVYFSIEKSAPKGLTGLLIDALGNQSVKPYSGLISPSGHPHFPRIEYTIKNCETPFEAQSIIYTAVQAGIDSLEPESIALLRIDMI